MRLHAPWLVRVAALALVALGGFTAAIVLPIPRESDEQREELMRQVAERFPGWNVINVAEAQERSWVVALRCADDVVGFRLLRDPRPADGLPPTDYWIAPDNTTSHARLREVSEPIGDWLVWRARPAERRQMPCEPASGKCADTSCSKLLRL